MGQQHGRRCVGAGQHQLSGLAHEGAHHILFRNRWFNDLASDLGVSLGVIRVLLGDLAYEGAITVVRAPRGPVTDERLLRQVLAGLQAL